MTHDVILSYYYYIMRNHISQEIPFLKAVIIIVHTIRRRIIIAHDVIISLQAVRGSINRTQDVIISLQQKLRENYQDGERVSERQRMRERESL